MSYIEREAAVKFFLGIAAEGYTPYHIILLAVARTIEAIPAADVRPVRRGKWIPVGTDDMDEGMFRCSECGSEHFFPELLLKIPADNFCSDCGADMRSEEGE